MLFNLNYSELENYSELGKRLYSISKQGKKTKPTCPLLGHIIIRQRKFETFAQWLYLIVPFRLGFYGFSNQRHGQHSVKRLLLCLNSLFIAHNVGFCRLGGILLVQFAIR